MAPKGVVDDPNVRPRKLPKVAPGDEVVISGVAGRFPDSDDVNHLYDNLMNKVDLVTDDDRRWKLGEFLAFYFTNNLLKNIKVLNSKKTFLKFFNKRFKNKLKLFFTNGKLKLIWIKKIKILNLLKVNFGFT